VNEPEKPPVKVVLKWNVGWALRPTMAALMSGLKVTRMINPAAAVAKPTYATSLLIIDHRYIDYRQIYKALQLVMMYG